MSSQPKWRREARCILLGVILIVLVFTVGSVQAGSADAHVVEYRPNIVLIVVEDLSAHIGLMDSIAQTPNLDRMASEGVLFTNVFATGSICAPSRVALITGMHQSSIGAHNHRSKSFGRKRASKLGMFGTDGSPYEVVPPAHVKAFPELLRRGGYYTTNNVKTDYQFGNPSSVWDDHSSGADWTSAPPDMPFFSMFSSMLTHQSGLFREGWANVTKGAEETAKNNTIRLKLLDAPTNPEDVVVPPFLPDTTEVRLDMARLYDNVQLMDRWVGGILEELEESGLLESSIVIWTTDHGDGLPRGKISLYDSGLHVPMIVRFPDGRHAGTVRDDLVSLIDLAPTILEMAELSAPDYMHGMAINFNQKDGSPRREFIFAAVDRIDEHPDRSRAIRSEQYKFIRNFNTEHRAFFPPLAYLMNIASMNEMYRLLEEGALGPQHAQYFEVPRPKAELFDLARDPFELHNLSGLPAYSEVESELSSQLDDWMARIGDLGHISERELVETYFWPGGIQPKTTPPIPIFSATLHGKIMVVLRPISPGISIEYRLPNDRWQIYTAPLELEPETEIEVRAIRYGYVPSEPLTHRVSTTVGTSLISH